MLKIRTIYSNNKIELIVEDDGAGMDAQECNRLLSGKSHSAGLKITQERLKLYFNSPSVFELTSEKGRGTVAKIIIPIDKEESDDSGDEPKNERED